MEFFRMLVTLCFIFAVVFFSVGSLAPEEIQGTSYETFVAGEEYNFDSSVAVEMASETAFIAELDGRYVEIMMVEEAPIGWPSPYYFSAKITVDQGSVLSIVDGTGNINLFPVEDGVVQVIQTDSAGTDAFEFVLIWFVGFMLWIVCMIILLD